VAYIPSFKWDLSISYPMEESWTMRFEDAFLHGNVKPQFIKFWLKEFFRKPRLLEIHPKLAALYQAPPQKAQEDEPLVPIEKLRIESSQEEFTLEGNRADLRGAMR
jgi:hypothetical protein